MIDEARPERGVLLGVGHASAHFLDARTDLHLYLGILGQVQKPLRVLAHAALRADEDDAFTVGQVEQRGRLGLSRFSTDGRQQQNRYAARKCSADAPLTAQASARLPVNPHLGP